MQTANNIPEPTIYDLHSTVLEAFLVAIDKAADITAPSDDALWALYREVRSAQVSAIERETGA